jgi:hypothetical protein
MQAAIGMNFEEETLNIYRLALKYCFQFLEAAPSLPIL